MNTKTANAVASLHTAANYLDETWKTYNQMRFVVLLGKCITLTGGFAAIAAGHPVIGCLWISALGLPVVNRDGDLRSLQQSLAEKWSPELNEAEKHFMAAESAVKEIKDTIQFWKEIPTLSKKIFKIHEDMLQKAEKVPITPKQAGLNAVWQVTAAVFGQNVRYSIQDIVKNRGRNAAKILRKKAEELNELTKLK